ncbi:MAG: hypothetical protein A3E78_13235 [Alphaproteobacteria bacterium RIFCSPHIGHO2_12_FULL_63_12]|nr:MAG: hypothetical protein A3E78_13235 [Alphaproteobacteria bacterium RIFCSPHIGHO2_12_FULL_63_12]
MKLRLNALIAAVACIFATPAAAANTGVALVHGTSAQTNAYNDYWRPEFVESVRQGLPNSGNLLVVNCDFTKYMWDNAAAGCLAGQLYNFVTSRGIDDLVVITHSNGSNVMRWIMSNPTWDSRYPTIISRIRWVNGVAASSAGTPLADAVMQGNIFEAAVGWLLGYQNDGVRQQQVSWMSYYNANWLLGTSGRPSLPKGFWNVVGSDVDSAIWDSDSYCGGYSENVGLEITQNWLDSCSDGFLNCTSQNAAGRLWFYDTSRTRGGEPLSHNQSRRQCFNLDVILRDDL